MFDEFQMVGLAKMLCNFQCRGVLVIRIIFAMAGCAKAGAR